MSLEHICLHIRDDLAKVEDVIQDQIRSDVPFVTHVAEYIVNNAGKRLRPILCLLSAKLAGYTGDKAINSAVALEFMHTASLLHDDVVDNATIRRGKTSANAKWGNAVSVLVGDFFYCRVCEIFVAQQDLRLLKLITHTMLRTTEGEVLEISRNNDVSTTEEEYLQVLHKKTADLLATSCEIGGVLANVSEEFCLALKDYGRHLGTAFQLADDILDYTADLDQFGKAAGTDLREGKMTLPLIVALKKAGPEEARIIKDALIANDLEEWRLKEVISIINKYEGIAYTMNLARNYVNQAKQALNIFKPSIEKEALLALADYVVERNK